mgnify:CR=1 FL=1
MEVSVACALTIPESSVGLGCFYWRSDFAGLGVAGSHGLVDQYLN